MAGKQTDGKKTDQPVRRHIEKLVSEEHELYAKEPMSEADRRRLESIKIELDQCWDLLRQRRALREFGEDEDKASVRPKDVVENYEQ